MNKSVPRELTHNKRATHVWLLKDNAGLQCFGATPNMAARFSDGISKEDIEKGTLVFDMETDDAEKKFSHMRTAMLAGLNTPATLSVVMNRERLLDVLSAVETQTIRLEFLPDVVEKDNVATNVVDGARYIETYKKRTTIDGVRIVEVKSPGDEASEDVACILGGMKVENTRYVDNTLKEESDARMKDTRAKAETLRATRAHDKEEEELDALTEAHLLASVMRDEEEEEDDAPIILIDLDEEE